jgi:hypothetical protein
MRAVEMKRIRYVHWDPAESEERAERIRSAGYEVAYGSISPDILKQLRNRPPAAVVIDLERLPSQGRDIGVALRTYKSTRNVPLVFVGGKPEKVARVEKLLPDAVFTSWNRIRGSLKRAIANPPKEPVVHKSALAAYSGTPLSKKLGIKESSKVALVGAPQGFEKTLAELPDNVSFRRRADCKCDLLIWFTRSRRDLESRIERLGNLAGKDGLWVMWPKKTSGKNTDLTQALVRRTGLASGLVDYKVCSVDTTWTGLRFARRRRK